MNPLYFDSNCLSWSLWLRSLTLQFACDLYVHRDSSKLQQSINYLKVFGIKQWIEHNSGSDHSSLINLKY